MIDFIKNNIEIIVLVAACIVDIVLFVMTIFKKKVNPSLDEVLVSIPEWVLAAEEKYGSGHGVEKKKYVMDLALSIYKHMTGLEVVVGSSIYRMISNTIEYVLKTPQKKER